MAIRIMRPGGGGNHTSIEDWITWLTTNHGTEDQILELDTTAVINAPSGGYDFSAVVPNGHKTIIRPYTGRSFMDTANASRPLNYIDTDGVAIFHDASPPLFYVNMPGLELHGLQVLKGGYNAIVHFVDGGSTQNKITNCIFGYYGSGSVLRLKNALVENVAISFLGEDNGSHATILCESFNVDLVNVATVCCYPGAVNIAGVRVDFATVRAVNVVSYGYGADFQGTFASGSKNCATDKATIGGTGLSTGAQVLVAASDFISVDGLSADLNTSPSSTKLKDLGANSGTPLPPTLDIWGHTRSGATDIGASEAGSGGGGPDPEPGAEVYGSKFNQPFNRPFNNWFN
jgi:hypothetical protein